MYQKHLFMSVCNLHNKTVDFQNRTTGSEMRLSMPVSGTGGSKGHLVNAIRPFTAGTFSASSGF